MSEESNISNEFDDVNEGGFVFFQLWRVEVLFVGEDEEVHTLQNAWERYWMDTKFCAVMRITKAGAANGYTSSTTSTPLMMLQEIAFRRMTASIGTTWGGIKAVLVCEDC